jgi:choline transport protein
MSVFQAATGSTAAAIGMSVPFVVLIFSMTLNSVAAASRQAWAFSRDGGLPFSPWFHKVHVLFGTPLPLNAMLSTMIMTVILGLINLGSAEAFNSINGLISGAIALTYALSIGCVLYRRLFGAPLPYARWSLGKLGILTNAVGFTFELFVMIMSFFPLFSKPTAYVSLAMPLLTIVGLLTLKQQNDEL